MSQHHSASGRLLQKRVNISSSCIKSRHSLNPYLDDLHTNELADRTADDILKFAGTRGTILMQKEGCHSNCK